MANFHGTSDTIQRVHRTRVYTADILAPTGGWTLQPRIWCSSLVTTMAPDVDEARFEIHHGFEVEVAGPVLHAPIDVAGKYVKVEVVREDGVTVAETWYGRFEVDARRIDGTSAARTGTQYATAYGLMRELENAFVRQSVVLDEDDVPRPTQRGLVANVHFGGVDRGNRSASTVLYKGQTSYVFSHEPISDIPWTAEQFITYLLAHHTPRNAAGNPPVTWNLVMPGGSFSWLDVAVETDRRSLKAILDEMLDRRRLCGWYVTGVEFAASFAVNVVVVTFNDAAIGSIPANPNTGTLVVDDGTDVEAEVTVSQTQVAERVIVEGAPITVTASWPSIFNDTLAEPGSGLDRRWTAAQQSAYLDGAGGADPVANDKARTADALLAVFRQFVPSREEPVFEGRITNANGSLYDIAPDIAALDAGGNVEAVFGAIADGLAVEFAWRHARFLPYLPIRDAETDEFRSPFAVFPDTDDVGGSNGWVFGHEANYKGSGRAFGVSLRVLQDAFGVVLDAGEAPQMIARSVWAGGAPNPTDPANDPTNDEKRGLDFADMFVTLCHEADDRVRVIRESLPAVAGQPVRERIVRIADARLDAVLPGTVLDIDANGVLIQQAAPGTWIRDDRTRLGLIADAAAEWYGKPRRALRVSFGQLRPVVNLGYLVTSIGATNADLWVDANAVVSRITYDFDQARTELHATYPEIDFGAVL